MNLENMQYAIDLMESEEVRGRFYIGSFGRAGGYHECETTACFACWLHWKDKVAGYTSQFVAPFLGISQELTRELCYISSTSGESDKFYHYEKVQDITPQDVADKLRELRDDYLLNHPFTENPQENPDAQGNQSPQSLHCTS